ncbi:hypothetical protein V6Z11_D08G165700 [Gossypium hirsutum]
MALRPMARDQMGICVPRMDRLIAMEMCHVYISFVVQYHVVNMWSKL